ncbi:hypothetical protein SBV1_1360014 [Verrucomicrobia bacterium]|nr:hypothetical protein SBV1_1360014 [Verrucomicrobiota bacterium]
MPQAIRGSPTKIAIPKHNFAAHREVAAITCNRNAPRLNTCAQPLSCLNVACVLARIFWQGEAPAELLCKQAPAPQKRRPPAGCRTFETSVIRASARVSRSSRGHCG